MTNPYNLMLHYDANLRGATAFVGTGALMHPICGQQGEIGVTPRTDLVECSKCQRILENSGVRERIWHE